MKKSFKEYRNHLILAEQKAQEDFDKTLIYLSGGALGISFAFVTDIIGITKLTQQPTLLIFAWICWSLCLTLVLISYFTSNLALKKAIKQVDNDKILKERPGGYYDKFTTICNISGAILFFLGLALMIMFVYIKLGIES